MWETVHLDDLLTEQHQMPPVNVLRNQSLSRLIGASLDTKPATKLHQAGNGSPLNANPATRPATAANQAGNGSALNANPSMKPATAAQQAGNGSALNANPATRPATAALQAGNGSALNAKPAMKPTTSASANTQSVTKPTTAADQAGNESPLDTNPATKTAATVHQAGNGAELHPENLEGSSTNSTSPDRVNNASPQTEKSEPQLGFDQLLKSCIHGAASMLKDKVDAKKNTRLVYKLLALFDDQQTSGESEGSAKCGEAIHEKS